MADPTDPRNTQRPTGMPPRTPGEPPRPGEIHNTTTHNTTNAPKRSGTSMALILGGIVVAVIVLFMLFSPGRTTDPGMGTLPGENTAPAGDGTAPAGGVGGAGGGTAPAGEPTAPAGDATAPAGEPPAGGTAPAGGGGTLPAD